MPTFEEPKVARIEIRGTPSRYHALRNTWIKERLGIDPSYVGVSTPAMRKLDDNRRLGGLYGWKKLRAGESIHFEMNDDALDFADFLLRAYAPIVGKDHGMEVFVYYENVYAVGEKKRYHGSDPACAVVKLTEDDASPSLSREAIRLASKAIRKAIDNGDVWQSPIYSALEEAQNEVDEATSDLECDESVLQALLEQVEEAKQKIEKSKRVLASKEAARDALKASTEAV